MKSALTSRVAENKFIVVDEMNFDEIKTKKFQEVLNNLNVNKALVVLEDGNTNVEISARNIPDVKTARTNTINVYDILKYNTVIATKAVVAAVSYTHLDVYKRQDFFLCQFLSCDMFVFEMVRTVSASVNAVI